LFDRQAMWGESNTESPVLTPEFCWSLSRGQVFRVRDARSPMVCRNLEEANPGTRIAPCLCAPIIVQREPLGVITFKEWQSQSFERVEQLAVTLAEKVGMALMNIRLRETLRMQSLRDALTGLFNRRYLDETLERELHRALRAKQTICVVMIDIDHFKKYNDTYGHDAGDALLQLFGKFLQEHVRGSDIACRYGGEEFVVVMPDTALDDSRKRAEQLRVGLKNLTLVYQGKQLEGITVSVGIAVFPEHGLTLRSLLKAADVALYSAKNQGRDCVAVALGKIN